MVTSGQYQRATRGRLPDWYLKQPRFYRCDEVYVHAFYALDTERRRSLRVIDGKMVGETGPIPWTAAIAYAEKFGMSRSGQFWFANVMLSLDAAYREHKLEEDDVARRRQARRERREKAIKEGRRRR